MKIEAETPEDYFKKVPDERKQAMSRLRKVILENLPEGFEETMNYGMVGYVVPHSLYPDGYHCDPSLPLPFLNLASQKNYIAIYHSGIYAKEELASWFIQNYKERLGKKPDMGKSCIRFKDPDKIPFDLIGELCTKITPTEWITIYTEKVKNR